MNNFRNLGRWYSAAAAILMAVGLAGEIVGFCLAVTLVMIQLTHFALKTRGVKDIRVLTAAAYLGALMMAYWHPLHFLYWPITAAAFSATLFSFDPVARMLPVMRRVPSVIRPGLRAAFGRMSASREWSRKSTGQPLLNPAGVINPVSDMSNSLYANLMR